MSSLLIQNTTINGQQGQFDILIKDGVFKAIETAGTTSFSAERVIDATGQMATAPFCEPHIHLDTTQTAG